MRTKLTTLLLVLMLTQVSAQSNWMTRNFKAYLSSGDTHEYIRESEKLLRDMSTYEREESMYVLELFKRMSRGSISDMPICYFNSAASAVGLSFGTKQLNSFISVKHCYAGGEYHYFLFNTLRKDAVSVVLTVKSNDYSGRVVTNRDNSGALPYSARPLKKSSSTIEYSLVSYERASFFKESECF